MRLLMINPNTTQAMTDAIGEAARAVAAPGTTIDAVSPDWGPASIEGHAEEVLSAAAVLDVVAQRGADYDGIAIACYGDPGLYAAREIASVPVVGIAEASMLMAATVAHSFSVVTVLDRIVPMLEDMVGRYGLSERCASVRGTPLAVLEIEADPAAAAQEVLAEARRAIAEDGAEAICLGCAGMAMLECTVRDELEGVPVIDGVAAAVKMLEAINGLGLKTSRRAAFQQPGAKELKGQQPFLENLRKVIPPTVAAGA